MSPLAFDEGDADAIAPLTVVVADSQIAIREAFVVSLTRNPSIKVVGEAGDGNRTVETCLRVQPRVLLLAAEMPGLGSIEICRILSAADVGVQVLVLVSQCEDILIRQLMEAGALGIVETTSRLNTLMRAVETVGEGRAFFGEQVTEIVRKTLMGFGTRMQSGVLSWREHEVLRSIVNGLSNKEIAAQLGICGKTVENHRANLMRKLKAHNGADLTREAFRLGVVKLPTEGRSESLAPSDSLVASASQALEQIK